MTATFQRLRHLPAILVWWIVTATVSPVVAEPEETETPASPTAVQDMIPKGWEDALGPEAFPATARTLALLAVVSLAPAILLMTTSYVRISIVLGLLRQSLGTQLLPSNQVITTLAIFMTLVIMWPVWTQVYQDAIVPYTSADAGMAPGTAWEVGLKPIRQFMSQQIDLADNSADVWLFYDFLQTTGPEPETYEQVPIQALLPAYLISELKVAFLIGFQIFLPFLIIDLVVASVSTSMGMMMLPPVIVSLPLKLLLFVLVDGWHLVVGMLMQSFSVVV